MHVLMRELREGCLEKVTFEISCENKVISLTDDIRGTGHLKQEIP